MLAIFWYISFLFHISTHPIHISKCDIAYNSKEQTLQIAYHIYIDDLEESLKQKGYDKLFIGTPKESPKAKEAIVAYLNEKFKIQVDDVAVQYKFVGKELSQDMAAIWCYLEVKAVKYPKKVSIFSAVLTELYDDQKNIITFAYDKNKSKYLLFDARKQWETINL